MRFFLLALTWAAAQAACTPSTSETVSDYTNSFDSWLRVQQLIRTRIAQYEMHSFRSENMDNYMHTDCDDRNSQSTGKRTHS